jgi:DNA-binding transcriptional ArsR family regulator
VSYAHAQDKIRKREVLESLITSKTRIKLLLKFFSNTSSSGHLRILASEFGESTNAVRVELNKLSDAGLLKHEGDGRKVVYRANTEHPLFPEINSIVLKFLGIDKIIANVLQKLGELNLAIVVGDYAKGIDSGIIDLILVGEIDEQALHGLIKKAESLIKRKIRPLCLNQAEYDTFKGKLKSEDYLVLWEDGLMVTHKG